MPVDDLERLSEDIAASAQIYGNGEISWPIDTAGRAIDALSEAGLLILGLDVRSLDEHGRISEVAWSSFDPPTSDASTSIDRQALVVQARDAALEALARPDTAEFGDRILITWQSLPAAGA